MKKLLAVILLALVLVAAVTGCGGAHRYDSRLTAADSLMQPNPDSALAIIEAVSPDSLPDEDNRAYRDLLLTQARYKTYQEITVNDDTSRHCLRASTSSPSRAPGATPTRDSSKFFKTRITRTFSSAKPINANIIQTSYQLINTSHYEKN